MKRNAPLSTSYAVYKKRTRQTHAQLNMIADNPDLMRIYPAKLFCNSTVKHRCVAQMHGTPLYADDDHLASTGARLLVARVVQRLRRRGWLPPAQGY